MKVVVFIDTDLTIRHFVKSTALRDLIQCHDVVFALPPRGHKHVGSDIREVEKIGRVVHIDFPPDRSRIWARWFMMEQMRFPTSLDKLRVWLLRWNMYPLKVLAIYAALGLPGIYDVCKLWFRYALTHLDPADFENFIAAERPALFLYPSTFSGHFINEVIDAGQRHGIPSVLLMNSWDNPSVKRAAAGRPDWVVVWGEQTRRHTVQMMGVSANRVIVLGAAQFDIFRDPPRVGSKAFREEHDISPDAKLVLYCGSNFVLKEAEHLAIIEAAIDSGRLPPFKVIYRPHPFGMPASAARQILDGPWKHVRIDRSMIEFLKSMAEGKHRGLYMADYSHTHTLLASVDAVISPLSTMLIEAGLHDRPTLCYYPTAAELDSFGFRRSRLRHFEELLGTDILLVSRAPEEFVPMIGRLLQRVSDKTYRETLRRELGFFVEVPPQRYPTALLGMLEGTVVGSSIVH